MASVDIVIVGGGISGIYLGHQLKEYHPNLSFLLLEKDSQIGGRLTDVQFEDTLVHLGGWLIRENDIRLLSLVKESKLAMNPLEIDFEYMISNFDPNWYNKELELIVSDIKENFIGSKNKNPTRQDLAFIDYLKSRYESNQSLIDKFISHSSFTDFLNCSTIAFLNYIPDDLKIKPQPFYELQKGWDPLFTHLSKPFQKQILLNHHLNKVSRIKHDHQNHNNLNSSLLNSFRYELDIVHNLKPKHKKYLQGCNTETPSPKLSEKSDQNQNSKSNFENKVIYCNHIVMTHSNQLHMLPILKEKIPKLIQIPFLKMFTWHKELPITNPIVVDHAQKKFFPISKHVMLSCYSDSNDALSLYHCSTKNEQQIVIDKINQSISQYIDLEDNMLAKSVCFKFWHTGTHGFPANGNIPIPSLGYWKQPKEGFWLVGECISNHQGWIEGCLESVDEFITQFKPNSFSCSYKDCKESFQNKDNLKNHELEKHCKTYTCSTCNQTFDRFHKLKNHSKLYHDIELNLNHPKRKKETIICKKPFFNGKKKIKLD